MEDFDQPEELNSPPERRLVSTLIMQKPHRHSLVVVGLVSLFIILVTQFYWLSPESLADLLPVIRRKVFVEGQWWRVFTATMIHGDLAHLLSNLYMLSLLSYFVYGYFGWSVFPVWTFLGAAAVNLLSISTYPMDTRLLGASGWVYLLGGYWLTLYFFIQRQQRLSQRVLRVCGIALMVFFPTSFEPTTSYRTHFIGFVAGMMFALIYFSMNKEKIRQKEVYRTIG